MLVVARTPIGPMPAISPASTPFFSSWCTYAPTSSIDGHAAMTRIWCLAISPVYH